MKTKKICKIKMILLSFSLFGMQNMVLAGSPTFSPFAKFPYEPSAITRLMDGRFLVVEDESEHPIDLLTLHKDGSLETTALTPSNQIEPGDDGEGMIELDDLEGAATDPQGRIYLITSHSRNKKGLEKEKREKLVRFSLGKEDKIQDVKVVTNLKKALKKHSPVLETAAAVLDVKNEGGLNIEGFTFGPDHRLMIAFRSPLVDNKAMFVYVENLDAIFDSNADPKFSSPVYVDLKGEGIREITYDPDMKGYWIISGPISKETDVQFNLWLWNPISGQIQKASVEGLAGFEHSEAFIPVRLQDKKHFLILSDDGDVLEEKSGHYLLLPADKIKLH